MENGSSKFKSKFEKKGSNSNSTSTIYYNYTFKDIILRIYKG